MACDDQKEISELDLNIDPENLETEFFEVLRVIRPHWQKDDVQYKKSAMEVSRGLLNTMVKCYNYTDPMDAIMVRIHNPELSKSIDRSIEITCIKYLHKELDCAPKILAVFKNGFCYEFIHGEILSGDRLSEEPIWRLIAEELAKIHSAKIIYGNKLNGEPQMKKLIDGMWTLYPDELEDPERNKKFKSGIPEKEILKQEIENVYEHLMEFKPAVVLQHGDTRAENIIWNPEKGVISFVDFEMMNYNYQAGELSLHFARFQGKNVFIKTGDYNILEGLSFDDHSKYPSEEFQMKWLRVYLEKYYECTGRNRNEVTDKDVRRLYVLVNKFYLFDLIASGVFGPAMETNKIFTIESIDFLEFSISNVRQYFVKKDEILKLEMPPE